jgi:glutamate N-acetyltransferase / amino-acid N-acetyltransferase
MAKASSHVSPFAPSRLPDMPIIEGVRFATCEAGIRYQNRTDLLVAVLDPHTTVAGVLTQSKTRSAPVLWCRNCLQRGLGRVLVVNSGNANAFTGKRGFEAVEMTAEFAAKAAACRRDEVYVASTGVIGEALDAGKFAHLLGGLVQSAKVDSWHEAARAILTTDTFPKLATRTAVLGGATVYINGFAKGAGMIGPDLATMLVFMFTDAPVAAPALRKLLAEQTDATFNCITIDGDTSTSDTVLLFATGKAQARGAPFIEDASDLRLADFNRALGDLMLELAHQVVRDGEGLTKFVTINVDGAESDAAARRIGFSIANSPLVKTAIAGQDPNWGRVVMAIGKCGEAADRDHLAIRYGDILVAENGERASTYDEHTVAEYMLGREIAISVHIGIGQGRATVWTCDLTHGYVSINADYRS